MANIRMGIAMLEFDSATHTYRVNGVVRPSVTQVLSSAGIVDLSVIPERVREFALGRGSAVHRACELHDREDLDEDALDPQLLPYLQAWKSFRQSFPTGFTHIEHAFADATLNFAGTLDRAGFVNSQRFVIDIKTNIAPASTAIQLAAYSMGAFAVMSARRIAVVLRGDGSFRVIEYPREDLMSDWGVFRAALAVHEWKENHR